MDDIRANIQEQMADQEEISNFFAEAAQEGQEELDNELEEMLAMDQME